MREILFLVPFHHSKLCWTWELQGSVYIILYHFTSDINHFYGPIKQAQKGFCHLVQPAASDRWHLVPLCKLKLYWPHTKEPHLNMFHYYLNSPGPWIKPLYALSIRDWKMHSYPKCKYKYCLCSNRDSLYTYAWNFLPKWLIYKNTQMKKRLKALTKLKLCLSHVILNL